MIVRVEDTAGNFSTARTQAYTLDTTAPTAAVSTVAFSADTGTSATIQPLATPKPIAAWISATLDPLTGGFTETEENL